MINLGPGSFDSAFMIYIQMNVVGISIFFRTTEQFMYMVQKKECT